MIDALVGLNPIAVDITGIGLLRTEAAVDIDLLNTGRPKGLDGSAESLQQPSTTGRETKAHPDLLQRCPMISRWQPARVGVKRRNQNATASILRTIITVNSAAVNMQ